jgi:predicted ester cyclase
MSEQTNKEKMRGILKDFFTHPASGPAETAAKVDKYWSPDLVYHSIQMGDVGFEQAKQFQINLSSALKPEIILKNIIIEADTAAVQFTLEGTHQATFMGIPATGKKVKIEIVEIVKYKAEKITEIWMYYDNLSSMKQIGAFPTAAAR